MSERQRRTPSKATLLTVREAAERLRASTATVYRLCALGMIPNIRVLNSIRIRSDDVG